MTSRRPDALDVHVEIDGEPVLAGTSTFRYRGATTSTEFTYARDYLRRPGAYSLDPALPLDGSRVFVENLPGAFADSAPDWWGRNLITNKLRLQASVSGEPPPLVTEVDFLVGVSDRTRQGSLRFREPGGQFLDPDSSVPKVVDLADLVEASDHVAAGGVSEGTSALKLLLAAGSATLGGARPKASIDDDGRLYVAKFPHRDDEWDVMAWEKTALDLAERAGIPVPQRRLVPIGGRHVLMLSRFDRTDDRRRIGYVSARTLAEASSSASNDYLDLAATIEDHSADASSDLRGAWLRAAFTVAVNNTDDHFRNHGFLRARGGWVLCPAFDINIDPAAANARSTSFAGASTREESIQALVREAAYFGMDEDEARDGLHAVASALQDWRDVARASQVKDRDLDAVGWVLDDYRERVTRLAVPSVPTSTKRRRRAD